MSALGGSLEAETAIWFVYVIIISIFMGSPRWRNYGLNKWKNQKSFYAIECDTTWLIFLSLFTQGWEVLPNSVTEILPEFLYHFPVVLQFCNSIPFLLCVHEVLLRQPVHYFHLQRPTPLPSHMNLESCWRPGVLWSGYLQVHLKPPLLHPSIQRPPFLMGGSFRFWQRPDL